MAETCVICGREKRDVYEGGSVGGPWCFEEMGESCCRLGYERAQAKLEQAERALAQARDGAFANIAEAEVIKLANRATAAESALAAAQGALRRVLEKVQSLIAEFGDRPSAALDIVNAYADETLHHAALAAESGNPEPRAAPPALPAELSGKGEQRAYSHEHVFDTQLLCKVCGGCALDLAEEAAEPGEAKKEEGT